MESGIKTNFFYVTISPVKTKTVCYIVEWSPFFRYGFAKDFVADTFEKRHRARCVVRMGGVIVG